MFMRSQVLGEHIRDNDLVINLTTKGKQLTNMRASGSDTNVRIAPAIKFSLEESDGIYTGRRIYWSNPAQVFVCVKYTWAKTNAG